MALVGRSVVVAKHYRTSSPGPGAAECSCRAGCSAEAMSPLPHADQPPHDVDVDGAGVRLTQQRAEAVVRLADMTADLESLFAASVDSNADDEHDPEGQTIAYERSQLTALIRKAEAQLADIDAAWLRLEQGQYGICDVCHEPIPAGRLEARPTARTCVRHAVAH